MTSSPPMSLCQKEQGSAMSSLFAIRAVMTGACPMFSDAAEERLDLIESEFYRREISKWADFPPSMLCHHGEDCCDLAIEWLQSMDFAQLNGGGLLGGPR